MYEKNSKSMDLSLLNLISMGSIIAWPTIGFLGSAVLRFITFDNPSKIYDGTCV